LAERKKYDFEAELNLARLDVDKLEGQVEIAQIQIISHNHSPWTIPQCLEALEQAPGMLEQYSQAGRLLIDNVRSVYEEFIARELSIYYQNLVQQRQMEEMKKEQDKLAIAPAGTFDELAARRERRKK
jgi:hypothetical protein